MTPEKQLEEFRKKKQLAQFRAMKSAKAKKQQPTQAPEAEDDGQSGIDAARGAIESVNKGITFGFGDEFVGLNRAVLDYLTPSAWGENAQSFGDKYRMYRDDQRAVQEEFADQNPATALGLELVGGFASPANFVGPGLQAAKAAGALKAGGQVGLRGAAEGAVAGVGTAEELSDIPEAAAKGAAIGGALSGALGSLGRAASSRKVAQELGSGDEFTPLNMIDANTNLEKGIRGTYQDIVGRLPFVKGRMLDQEASVLKEASEEAGDRFSELAIDAKAAKRQERNIKNTADKILKKSIGKIDEDIAAKQLATQQKQASRSLPEYVTNEVRDRVSSLTDGRAQFKELDDFWTNDAYQSVKSQNFDIDENLLGKFKREFSEDDLMYLFNVDDVDDILGRKIGGEELMEMRNAPATASTNAAGKTRLNLRKKVSSWDKTISNLMEDQMGEGASKQFKADNAAYGDWISYRDAAKTAAADRRGGLFTGDELASVDRRGKTKRSRGESKAQVLGLPMREAEQKANILKKSLKDKAAAIKSDPVRAANLEDQMDEIKKQNKAVKERLKDINKRKISEHATFPSQMATAVGLGLMTPFTGPLAPAAVVAGGNLMSTQPGQRFVAGQTGWQKALQDDERAKLLAQLLRQSTSRAAAGE